MTAVLEMRVGLPTEWLDGAESRPNEPVATDTREAVEARIAALRNQIEAGTAVLFAGNEAVSESC